MPKLQSWPKFKEQLFEIYDHRLLNAEEIDGGVNNTFMSLDEHLVCYLFEKAKTRQKTEIALISFLASLRYYVDLWFRARQYA